MGPDTRYSMRSRQSKTDILTKGAKSNIKGKRRVAESALGYRTFCTE